MLSYDVVEWGRPLQAAERPTPQPRGTEVLVRLKYCGVCHSDAHIRDGYFDLGGGKRLHMSERGMEPPVTLGHDRSARSSPRGRTPVKFRWARIVSSIRGRAAAHARVAAQDWTITAWRRT